MARCQNAALVMANVFRVVWIMALTSFGQLDVVAGCMTTVALRCVVSFWIADPEGCRNVCGVPACSCASPSPRRLDTHLQDQRLREAVTSRRPSPGPTLQFCVAATGSLRIDSGEPGNFVSEVARNLLSMARSFRHPANGVPGQSRSAGGNSGLIAVPVSTKV